LNKDLKVILLIQSFDWLYGYACLSAQAGFAILKMAELCPLKLLLIINGYLIKNLQI